MQMQPTHNADAVARFLARGNTIQRVQQNVRTMNAEQIKSAIRADHLDFSRTSHVRAALAAYNTADDNDLTQSTAYNRS